MGLVVVSRPAGQHGAFVPLPRRWVVERTFAWLMRTRRLARDYERLTASVAAMIRWSMTLLMIRRLARQDERVRGGAGQPAARGQALGPGADHAFDLGRGQLDAHGLGDLSAGQPLAADSVVVG
ncbi:MULTISPECIES: IS5/IS1182 family transposase [Streptomyces]|uniref:Transposase DDE domain-containing protein n=1 Tax=Streptomyces cacaoi TaxID=1898 RepID=A0A4Y3QW65_STRCI|nr:MULTISPECIES: IS5/IS1182 family transposase [Streptomyces]GEB49656.1 hypothetical protein SCA03_22070 [Streptomyces cacaoi]